MVDTTAAQRANLLKAKVRRVFADIDESKSGYVKERLFYDMLGYNGIAVQERDRAFIRKKTGRSDRLNYREALAMLYIRIDSPDPLNEPWIVRDARPLNISFNQSAPRRKIPLDEAMRSTITGENAFAEVRRSINHGRASSMSRQSVQALQYIPRIGSRRHSPDPLDDPIGSVENPIEAVEQIELERRKELSTIKQRRKPKKMHSPLPQTAQATGDRTFKVSPKSPKIERSPDLERLYRSVELEAARQDSSSLSQDGQGKPFGSMARRKTSKIKDQFFHDPEDNYNIISNAYQNFDDKDQYKNPEARRAPLAKPSPPKQLHATQKTGDLVKFSGSTHKQIPDFLRGLYSNPVAEAETIKLIQRMIEVHVDNRQLNNIRMGFLKLDTGNRGLLNLFEFQRKLVKVFMSACPMDLQDQFVNLVRSPKNESVISYDRVAAFIDLFQYFPYVIKRDKNFSEDVYFALSSNKAGKAFFDWTDLKKFAEGETELQSLLDYFWLKVQTKFTHTNQAFRFFDVNSDGQITFNEFCVGLENLNMKLSKENALKIFKYIDSNHSNDISYFEFCDLCEERRRAIDPFEIKQDYLANLYEKKKNAKPKLPNEPNQIISTQLQHFKQQRKKKLPDSLNPSSFTFGRKTEDPDADMSRILNNDYQAQWLEQQLAKEGEYLSSEVGSHISSNLSGGSKKLRKVFKSFHTKASKQMQDNQLKKLKEKERSSEQDKLKMYFRTPRLKNLSIDSSSNFSRSLGGGVSDFGARHQHECQKAYQLPEVPGSRKAAEIPPHSPPLMTEVRKMPPLLKDEQKQLAQRNAIALSTPHEKRMKSLVREIYTPSPPALGHKKQSSEDMFRKTGVFNDRLKRRLDDEAPAVDPRQLFRQKQSPLLEKVDEAAKQTAFSRFTSKRGSGRLSHTSTSFHKSSF